MGSSMKDFQSLAHKRECSALFPVCEYAGGKGLGRQMTQAINELESCGQPGDSEHGTAVSCHRGKSPEPAQWTGYPPADGGEHRIMQGDSLRQFGAKAFALCLLLQERGLATLALLGPARQLEAKVI